jgi:hypothetical protein
MTEGGTGGHTWPEPLNDIGAMLHNSLVHGHASRSCRGRLQKGGPVNTV